jgi:hypothetical protein
LTLGSSIWLASQSVKISGSSVDEAMVDCPCCCHSGMRAKRADPESRSSRGDSGFTLTRAPE